jgi:DNA-binding CsgD family transcriptional regulator
LAARRGSDERALRYLQRALEEVSDGVERTEMLAHLGELELRLGEIVSAERHLREACALETRPCERPLRAAVAARAIAAGCGCDGAISLLEAELERDLAAGGSDQLDLAASMKVLELCHHVVPAPPTIEALDPARADTSGGRAMLAVSCLSATLHGASEARRVVESCDAVLAGLRTAHLAGRQLDALYFAGLAALLADGFAVVEAVLEHLAADGTSHGGIDRELVAQSLRSQLWLVRGGLPSADGSATEVLETVHSLPPDPVRRRVRSDALVVRVLVALHQRRVGDAAKALRRLTSEPTGSRHPAVIPLQVMLASADGTARQGIPAALSAGIGCLPDGTLAPALAWRPALALAYQRVGDASSAAGLVEEHLAAARSWGGASLLVDALLAAAATAEGAARRARIEEAINLLERCPASVALARARIELGSVLRRERHRKEARDQLEQGADIAHRCHAHALAQQARTELVAAGARPRRHAYTGPDSLTVSERRVAELAAGELTNRQIAHTLTVSMKTVAGQLNAVYRKLGVHDRRALAEVLHQRDGAGEVEG